MQWDLGIQGLAYLGAMSLGFAVLAAAFVGGTPAQRLLAAAVTTVGCFGVGLLVSEGMFGWATEEELQPNIDGLSRDEALLASVLTTAVVVLGMRYLSRRRAGEAPRGWHLVGRGGRHHHA